MKQTLAAAADGRERDLAAMMTRARWFRVRAAGLRR
jgi:hypothetical protein